MHSSQDHLLGGLEASQNAAIHSQRQQLIDGGAGTLRGKG